MKSVPNARVPVMALLSACARRTGEGWSSGGWREALAAGPVDGAGAPVVALVAGPAEAEAEPEPAAADLAVVVAVSGRAEGAVSAAVAVPVA